MKPGWVLLVQASPVPQVMIKAQISNTHLCLLSQASGTEIQQMFQACRGADCRWQSVWLVSLLAWQGVLKAVCLWAGKDRCGRVGGSLWCWCVSPVWVAQTPPHHTLVCMGSSPVSGSSVFKTPMSRGKELGWACDWHLIAFCFPWFFYQFCFLWTSLQLHSQLCLAWEELEPKIFALSDLTD